MPLEMNLSLSSVPYSLELLADVDILEKSVSDDFSPVSDVVLFQSFEMPLKVSLYDLSKGTLIHQLVSDVSSRPSDDWWSTAMATIVKNFPHEIDPAACAAEIYLARVAQTNTDMGNVPLDISKSGELEMEFIDSHDDGSINLIAITKQEGIQSAPAEVTVSEAAEFEAMPANRGYTTVSLPEDANTFGVGGPVVSDTGGAITGGRLDTGIIDEAESKDLDGALIREGRRGEEIQHDNSSASAMGGLGLSGDGEIRAVVEEESKSKQNLLDDIELISRKIEESERLRSLLEKVKMLTGEEDAVKRLESHVHPSHPITEGHDDLEMKAGST